MSKHSILRFIKKALIISLCIPFVMTVNFAVDPLQFYHKSVFFDNQIYTQERYQDPGIAKNFQYDTVVIGTSMVQNFSPKYISEKLGMDAVKLSMAGSSIYEQNLILNLAIKSKKAENVLWGLDYSSFAGKPGRVRDEDVEFPYYLYDNNFLNDYKYLINSNTSEMVIDAVIRKAKGDSNYNEKEALEEYSNWSKYAVFKKENALKGYFDLLSDPKFKEVTTDFDWTNLQWNADNRMISVIKNNPDVNFYLFFTPCSVLSHKYYYEKSPYLFENELKLKKYIVTNLSQYKNVKIYDFQAIDDINLNLSLYKDQSHYNEKVNQYVIDSIAADTNRITEKNVNQLLGKLKNWVVNVKVDKSGISFQ